MKAKIIIIGFLTFSIFMNSCSCSCRKEDPPSPSS